MEITVEEELIGTSLHKLSIYADGMYIGEYERSAATQIQRKKAEIERAKDLLIEVFRKHGEFCVRWDQAAWAKSIRVNDVEVGRIPESLWGTP